MQAIQHVPYHILNDSEPNMTKGRLSNEIMILSTDKRLCNNRTKKCIYKTNKRGGAYPAYNSSKEVENAVPVVSGVEENGHVSSAFWHI